MGIFNMEKNIDWLKLENRIRATPLDLLKQGVYNRQWAAVDAAFTMLTGLPVFPTQQITEPLPSPAEPEEKTYFPKNGVIAVPHVETTVEIKDEEEEDIDEDEDEEEDNGYEFRGKKTRLLTRTSPVNVKGIPNKFVDDGVEAKEDLALMPKPEVMAKRHKKRRTEYKTVKVKCHKCGTVEKVDPILAPSTLNKGKYKMRYVCNDCSCSGGS